MPERITLSRKAGWRMPANTKKVARPGPFGNPFFVDADLAGAPLHPMACATNEEACEKFERELLSSPELMARVRMNLRGFNLACFCKKAETCHADILLRVANQ